MTFDQMKAELALIALELDGLPSSDLVLRLKRRVDDLIAAIP